MAAFPGLQEDRKLGRARHTPQEPEHLVSLARCQHRRRFVEDQEMLVDIELLQNLKLLFLSGGEAGDGNSERTDRPLLARAVRATLKPGGHFALVNWHQRPREETMILGEPRGPRTELRLSPEQTIEAVTPADLRLFRIVDVTPYHYGAIFERAAS